IVMAGLYLSTYFLGTCARNMGSAQYRKCSLAHRNDLARAAAGRLCLFLYCLHGQKTLKPKVLFIICILNCPLSLAGFQKPSYIQLKMPELPEVETSRAGLAPHVKDQTIVQVAVHNARLRWPIAADLAKALTGQKITQLTRRAKYFLFHTQRGYLIIHLG